MDNGFLTSQSWHILKSWDKGRDQEKDLGAGSQLVLSRGLVSSMTQAIVVDKPNFWRGGKYFHIKELN